MCLCCTDRSASAQCIHYLLTAAQLSQETSSMTSGSSICEGKLVNLPVSSRICTLCYHCLHCSVVICQCQGHTTSVGPCLTLLPPSPLVLLPPTAGHPITGVNTIVRQHYEMITGFSQKPEIWKKERKFRVGPPFAAISTEIDASWSYDSR